MRPDVAVPLDVYLKQTSAASAGSVMTCLFLRLKAFFAHGVLGQFPAQDSSSREEDSGSSKHDPSPITPFTHDRCRFRVPSSLQRSVQGDQFPHVPQLAGAANSPRIKSYGNENVTILCNVLVTGMF